MKHTPSRVLLEYAADELSTALTGPWKDLLSHSQQPLLVPIPSLPAHVRERMIDIPLMLAAKCALRTGSNLCRLLAARDMPRAQKSQRLTKRFQSARCRLKLIPGLSPTPQPLILCDDVITSGASVTVATQLLQKAGWHVGAIIALAAAHDRPMALEHPALS